MDLNGAAVVVTGGRGGLGSVICQAFVDAGSRVLAVDVIPPDSGRIIAGLAQHQADTATPEGTQSLVGAALAELGRIDVLVNNAGINKWVEFTDLDGMTDDLWDSILGTNLKGPWLCSKAVAPVMQRQQRGRIVSVASIAGLRPSGSSIAYCISKAGVIHLTRCLAVALAPHVLVNAVAPGLMEGTGMTVNLSDHFIEDTKKVSVLGQSARLEDVAAQIVAFARSDTITGQTVPVDAGVVFH
ncbi:MAG TPA: SDR family NAD(P)-dependent oxidoreductase [Chloroflexota bacterium]|nr:SDR family NAD(P)-dependent oxidoreductase [Chloroflexota bacterium]